ncbi:MAG: hypothetical protein A2045_04020 [Rhodocyclales bacterium GWA2_65_20]|nr:MAG: hypothetical protein A2045_04020 [Rhodocyclales bacterium GWA2_65_20]
MRGAPLQVDWNKSLGAPAPDLPPASDRDRAGANAELAAMIDFSLLNEIFENFLEVTGLPIAILDLNGKVLASSKWQRLCLEFHRANKDTLAGCIKSDTVLSGRMQEGSVQLGDRPADWAIYQCANGLTDCATPIRIEGVHVANLFTGQFLRAAPDMAYFKRQQEAHGFEETAYFQALADIPIVSEQKIPAVLKLLRGMAQQLARQSLAQAKLQAANTELEAEIARRQRTQEALQEATQMLQTVINTVPQFVFWKDRESRYLGCNQTFAQMAGVAAAPDLVGKSDYDLAWRQFAPLYRRDDAEVMATGSGKHNIVEPVDRGDGEVRWLETSKEPLRDAQGRVFGVLGMFQDITERRTTEEQLAATLHRLDAHLGNSPLAVIEFDPGFRVTRWSGDAERIFGWRADEIVGQAIAELRWVHEDDAALVQRTAAELSSGAASKNLCINRNYRKDGSVVQCEWYNSALHDKDGRMISILSQVLDVTARTAAENALAEAKEKAEQASRAKSAFLANMSHEIRTPLNVIIGLGHLLRRNLADPVQEQRLAQLCASSDHLLALVNDILDLSKIEADRLVLDASGFRLGTVVDRVLEILARPAGDKGLKVTAVVAPAVRQVALRGDPVRLEQILINLGSNAVKFTHQGTVRLEIAVRAEDAATMTLGFAVADTGIGIAAADQAQLFQVFTQVDASPTRTHGGSGLGLAISQRLAALMGGKIAVESQTGVGSRFSFELTLPRATGVPAAAAAVASDLRGLRVLFAEDHPLSQEILFEMLEHIGCEVEAASDGAEALACAQARSYDLILMDMQMPKMDGLAATRAIRALPGHRDTPIIALTANAFAEDRQRCLDAGMNGHIGKPVTPATLAAVLGQWLPDLAVPRDEAPACDNELGRALAGIAGLNVGSVWRGSPQRLADYRAQLDLFVTLHAQDMARLREQLAAGGHDAAHVVAHNLKGIAGLIGARRIAALADEIVHALRTGKDADSIAALTGACEAELAGLAQAVRTLPAA